MLLDRIVGEKPPRESVCLLNTNNAIDDLPTYQTVPIVIFASQFLILNY
jgi:hypothetical protein